MYSFLFAFCSGWITGTAAQLQQGTLWPDSVNLAGCCVCVTALLAVCLSRNRLTLPSLAQVWLIAGLSLGSAFFIAATRAQTFQATQIAPDLEGQTIELVGMVTTMPQQMDGNIRFGFLVHSATSTDGTTVSIPLYVLLGWYANTARNTDAPLPYTLRAGDIWKLTVRLKAPHGHLNPYGFDYELWLWEHDYQATGYVRVGSTDPAPQWIAHTWRHPIERIRQWVRDAVFAQVAERRSAGVVAALLMGDQSAIERADWDIFRATGVAHLMAISGLHITGLAWLFGHSVGWVWRRSDRWSRHAWCLRLPAQQAAQIAAWLIALAYSMFTGWAIPAQRTVCMLTTVLLLRLLGLRWPFYIVLLSAATVVLALDPWAFLQAGFWLSFIAVACLFVASTHPKSTQPDVREGPMDSQAMRLTCSQTYRYVKALVQEQWLMSICMAPISIFFFHQVSLVGFFANLVAVPWVTCVVTPLTMVGLVLPFAWSAAAWVLSGLEYLLDMMAHLSWAQRPFPAVPWWIGLSSLAGIFVFAKPGAWWRRVLGLLCVVPVFIWKSPRPAFGEFELISPDIGQGNAVLVRTLHTSLLYDTGPRYSSETDAGQRVLVPLLMALGERLDRIIISHQDSDHSGGAHSVMQMQAQADILTSIGHAHPLRKLHAMQDCMAGQHWEWDGVKFSILHPQANDYAIQRKPNAMSCVLRIESAHATRALLVADIEMAQEMRLLQSNLPLQADWLLVPHHGSSTSSSDAFLDAVNPRLAIVQAGYRNRFGHPRSEVMARYEARKIQHIDSARCGASTWSSDAPDAIACEREQRRRYWHHVF